MYRRLCVCEGLNSSIDTTTHKWKRRPAITGSSQDGDDDQLCCVNEPAYVELDKTVKIVLSDALSHPWTVVIAP
jgi:hypothetical protein